MRSFTTQLIVTPIGDGRRWRLKEPFEYYRTGREHIRYIVPAGFVTDFASVPRILWPILPPYGRYGKAAVLHDYLYRSGIVERYEADLIFKEAMEVLGVAKWKMTLLYWGVRFFGAKRFKQLRKENR